MIRGEVNASDEAVIPIAILDSAVAPHTINAVADTGFTGALTLPSAMITSLGLIWVMRSSATLADGSMVEFDVYDGQVHWDGKLRDIAVESAEIDPIVGMSLLRGHFLGIEVIDGGSVTIDLMP